MPKTEDFGSTPPSSPLPTVFFSALIAILLGAAFLIYQNESSKSERAKVEIAKEAKKAELDAFRSFDDLIARADRDRLIRESNQLRITTDLELPVKVALIQKRLRIANRLLEFEDDPKANRFGLVSKMEVLTLWNTLNVIHKLGENHIAEELNEIALNNVDSRDGAISSKAALTLALTSIHEYIQKPSDKTFKVAKDYFDQAAETQTDFEVADALFNIALLVRQSDHIPESVAMFKTLHESYKTSDELLLKQIADNAYEQYVFTEYDLTSVVIRIQEGDATAMEEFHARVDRMLNGRKLSKAGFRRLFSMIEAVMQTGETVESRKMMMKLKKALPQTATESNFRETEILLDSMIRRVDGHRANVFICWPANSGRQTVGRIKTSGTGVVGNLLVAQQSCFRSQNGRDFSILGRLRTARIEDHCHFS